MSNESAKPIWIPDPELRARSLMVGFAREAERRGAPPTVGNDGSLDYRALHGWSISEREEFWRLIWDAGEVIGDRGRRIGVGLDRMAPPDPVLGPRWFPDARINFAENLLRWRDDRTALVSWTEAGPRSRLTYAELAADVARVAGALKTLGVREGDRVAGYMPNISEAVIAMLAAASIGAVWSSCSMDFGARAVVDRFGQIEPRVLVCADGYRYAGKTIERGDTVREIVECIPSIEHVIMVAFIDASVPTVPGLLGWDELPATSEEDSEPEFARLPFDHSLYIMYSSGTTGLPKCMVHGAGGTLLQHLKELMLHVDLRREDRIFYFTTCGWMMWNWLVSSLAVGATTVLYDGAPMHPHPASLWDMVERERLTVFGTSAKYLALLEKSEVRPGDTHDLSALRTVLSTGSPLVPHSFDYVYNAISESVHLASISGGTDIISCFVLGDPTSPVWRGEIQGPGLGMAVEVWNNVGERVVGDPGELVCTRAFPSMPVSFWNDADGMLYRAAYFDHVPGVWRHGDWVEETEHGGYVIHGRSDATLNPGGVRIGTSEIYRQVEQLEDVVECLAVGQEIGEGAGDVRVVLFVRLRDGLALEDALRERIRRQIRDNTSPHHVPHAIVQVSDLPRTISGKISEIAVREVIHGRPAHNVDALANPRALDEYRNMPELR